ncbi:MAG: hypothetical protein ABIG90_01055 [bacterium]
MLRFRAGLKLKILAHPLRDQAAQELKRARKVPKNYAELKEYSGELCDPKIKEIAEKMKHDILGRIFKTLGYKELETTLAKRLESEKKQRIESSYENFEEKLYNILRRCPLSEEEQKKYLSEEAMTTMDLEDYLVLLKRLSGNYLTHVTRYGVREQTFMFHHAGEGNFLTSFTDVLKEKKLHSFFTNIINEAPFLTSVIQEKIDYCLNNSDLRGEQLVNEIFDDFVREEKHGATAADKSSVHFALNDIAASCYGAEKGYDFYFYYPAEFIAHNYYTYIKKGGDLTYDEWRRWSEYDQHNDVAIWNKGKGIPIDAGLVCVPADIMVDRETGSQYKLLNGEPVIEKVDENGKKHFALAENPIRSQEFWEEHFNKHPGQRPSKMIYYHSPFRTYAFYPPHKTYKELLTKQQFHTAADLPSYEEYIKYIYGQFKDKIRELIILAEKKCND